MRATTHTTRVPVYEMDPPGSAAGQADRQRSGRDGEGVATSGKWAQAEFRYLKLGDERLRKRAVRLVTALASRPVTDLPYALANWAQEKAACRFLGNGKVVAGNIRRAHARAAIRRARGRSTVLAIQDTTEIDFTSHKRMGGLGPIGISNARLQAQRGLELHSTLLVNSDGEPLGVIGQRMWARDPAKLGQGKDWRERPIEEKETHCWLQGVRQAERQVPRKHRLIHVGDAGADVYDLFALPRRPGSHLLIRLAYDRCLEEPPMPGSRRRPHLMERVAQTPLRAYLDVRVRARPAGQGGPSQERVARLSVRFARVTLRPPDRLKRRYGALTVTVIWTREENPPPGVEALEWLLLTTLSVPGLAAALQCVRWYALRWLIEHYHFTLKSGLGIERFQLEDADRFERALALCTVVAWRILSLTYLARLRPETPASAVFERYEWEALYCVTLRTPDPPAEPPSIRQVVRWIAKLGGFLGRTGDKEPGLKTLWRGLARLHDIAETWRFAQNCRTYG